MRDRGGGIRRKYLNTGIRSIFTGSKRKENFVDSV